LAVAFVLAHSWKRGHGEELFYGLFKECADTGDVLMQFFRDRGWSFKTAGAVVRDLAPAGKPKSVAEGPIPSLANGAGSGLL
jgi:hypothetical protein